MFLIRKAIPLVLLIAICPLFGYRISYDKDSVVPKVKIWMRPASSATDALKKHLSLQFKSGIPDTVVDIAQKIKGISAPAGNFLNAPTKGWSVKIAKGVQYTADALQKINSMFGSNIKDIIGRIDRGSDEAYHKVVRGNRGRDGEWAVNKDMYAIVTLPDSYVPLNEPYLVRARTNVGFIVTATPDPDIPGNVILSAHFNPASAAQGQPAEDDKRDRGEMRKLAEESGEWAYMGRRPTAQELAEQERRILEAKKAELAKANKEASDALGLPENATDYQVLGVANNATKDQITKAFRNLTLKWHPDRNPNNRDLASKVFNKIQAAYDALSNTQEKA